LPKEYASECLHSVSTKAALDEGIVENPLTDAFQDRLKKLTQPFDHRYVSVASDHGADNDVVQRICISVVSGVS